MEGFIITVRRDGVCRFYLENGRDLCADLVLNRLCASDRHYGRFQTFVSETKT